jgi:outer membrane receptor protein involved in Fe transport
MRVEPEDDEPEQGVVEIKNNIKAVTVKEDFQYFYDTHNTFDYGLQYTFYNFLPGEVSTTGNSAFQLLVGKRNAREGAIYLAHELQTNNRFKLNYGLRYCYFSINGLGDRYDFSNVTDLPYFDFHEQESTNYGGFEPRFIANYQFKESISYKFGYARNYQNIHMISKSTPGTPLDVWQPSSSRIKPQCADQITAGVFRKLNHSTYDLSIELFYKHLKNQVDFENGANIIMSTLFESNLVYGTGYAYGIEFLLKKQLGKLTGWVGYSLSKSRRKFKEINQGKAFPPKFDRTHDFSIVADYKFNSSWTFAANWVYFTGNAMTIPYGKYMVNGQIIEAFSERNAFRMPAYHRLDIDVTYTMKKGHTWNLSLYNAYGRKNAYAILLEGDDARPMMLSLFSFVPSLSFNFLF